MDKNIKKEEILDNIFNSGYKSISNNLRSDMSQNSLLSSNNGKLSKEKKDNDNIKRLNTISDKSLNKQIKKQIEDDLLLSSKRSKTEIKQSIKKIKNNDKNKILDKIIVDNIENIYSNITKLPNKLFWQTTLLLIICFYVNSLHWIFLFITKRKMERDYCFTKLNQFEVCSPEQYCSTNMVSKINYHLYNDSLDFHNSSISPHQVFMKEMKSINEYYKSFYITYNYELSKNGLFTSIDMTQKSLDKFSFVIILTKKEKWNIFLHLYSYCDKDMYYFYIIGMIFLGGFFGSILFGIFADAYGRKLLIIITLFLVSLSLTFLTIISFTIEKNYHYYLNDFKKNYKYSQNDTNYDILSKIYSQRNTEFNFRSYNVKFLFSIFLLNMALRPLSKICLSLLLENSTSELIILDNFRRYTFITTALPPFFIAHILIIFNNFTILFLFLSISFFILFFCSIFILSESIRYLYELCEWKELTKEVLTLFKITDDIPITYKNKIEFESFVLEEDKKMFGNISKRVEYAIKNKINYEDTKFNIINTRLKKINRDIKRNCEVIIKKIEIQSNLFIIYSCLSANTLFKKSRFLIFILRFIIYFQQYFVEKELLEIPFYGLSDLYLNKDDNIIINSNFFILGIVLYLSNYFYHIFYRISCFNIIFFSSLIIVTILFISYHCITVSSEEFPVDLSEINFAMLGIQHIKTKNMKSHIILFFIEFLLNGIDIYINLIFLKLSKTLYRCTFLGFNTIILLFSIGFGDTLIFQIRNFFLLLGSLNFFGIVAAVFLGEFKNILYIINDLKKYKQR